MSLRKHCIDVIIFDSSKDERTKNVVRNFQIDGFYNVTYERYDGIYDGFSLDHKVIEAFRQFADKYEYLWVCRDGLIVDGAVAAEEVFPVMDNKPDFIVTNPLWRCEKEYGGKKYTDCTEFFAEQCMQMTVLGATIVKSSTIISILNSIPLEEGRNYSLWQPIAYFEYIANHDFVAEYVEKNIWYYNSADAPKNDGKNKSIHQWCWEWYHVVTNLPACYDPYKKEILKIHMSDFHPFFARELVKIRAGGGLTWKELKRNREILPYVCDTKLGVFYAVALLPKSVCRYLAEHPEGKIGKLLRGIYCVIRGIAPGEVGIEE